ncbi:MAG TPA: hypothetical protein VMH91_02895 [Candidatus Paceibacterota bacterium]|nr:hypothetical protein [Candidatus Paceibacterota bacterium]
MVKRRFAIVALLTLLTLAPTLSSALGLVSIVPDSCKGAGGCQSICDLAQLAQNALTDGIYIAIFLSAILFAWAGWNMIIGSSSGNTAQVSQAKKIFWNVTIGLVLILTAWIIVSVIMAALTTNASWNTLCSQP